MPELPEVRTIVSDLKYIEGSKVIFNRLINDTVFKTPFYKLDGRMVEKIESKGKYIIIKFDITTLLIHLSMSGQLFVDFGDETVPKHCQWLIQLDVDREQIRYVDHRKFGKIMHFKNYEDAIQYVNSKLGPDPWEHSIDSFHLNLVQKKYKNKAIKEVLMDQKLIAGIGNIYAAEALFRAKINPFTIAGNLEANQVENLLYSIRYVLDKGIKNRGTSFSDYRTGKGTKGENQNHLKVYKQKTCSVCNGEIFNDKLKGRSTYYCHNCQRKL